MNRLKADLEETMKRIVLILGTFIAVWPQATGRRKASYTIKPGTIRPQPSAGD